MNVWQTLLTIYGCGALFMTLAIFFTDKRDREGFLFSAAAVALWPISLALLLASRD
jgi:hypothetical protein